jgi:PqqD family protein of HPr-rel-A system
MPKPGRLIWRNWGDESVVFDQLSGETHLFDVVTAEVVRFLEARGTVDTSVLCREIARQLEIESDTELEDFLNLVIDGTIAIGLVEEVADVASR